MPKSFPLILISVLCVLLFSSTYCFAQNKPKPENTTVRIIHANSLEHDDKIRKGAERLIGKVVLEDDSNIMCCDSAYLFNDNSFFAWRNVHINRKDSIDIYGDSLHYHGSKKDKEAELFGKIRCLTKSMTLTTHHLKYNIHNSSVNYWDGGTIVDTANTLVSILGTYNMKAKMCYFKKDVKLTAPKYTVRCDTMNYEPELRKAYFFGPTHITSKNNYMYCVKGYYSTKTNISQFSNGAYIINKKGSRLSGNQLYYDRGKDRGQVMDNVSLWDSANNVTITGEYADYKGDDRTILVTCHALMDQVYDKDTLHLHADTLFGNNISVEDSAGSKDSGKILLAFHHVKFFKKDLQGKCDSLTYDEKDSIMNMYHSPVLWSDENQLTADTMHMLMKNKKMNVLLMNNNSFIASLDTIAKQLAGEDKIKADSAKKDTGTHKIDTVKSSAKDSGHVSLVHDSVHISHVKDSGNVSFAKDSGHISSVHDSVQASSIQDSDQYNQIKGKNMKGFFRDNKMYKVLVKGNAQTIYYPYSDNNTTAVGSNRAECSNMLIFIEKNKIKSITFLQKPDATLYPMKDIKKSEFFLGGFKWRDNERPHKVEDIFN